MILTRTPVRIPLGGGGTDLPSYYTRYGGRLISAAINKYVYIIVNKRFEKSIRVSYSRTEIADTPDDIEHPIVREAVKFLGLDGGIEIVSIADVPSNTGLGSSSSFTVGLLNALHAFRRDHVSTQQLAEEACHIEMDLLGEPVGKQDQYIAAFGGIIRLDIDPEGRVDVAPVRIAEGTIEQLEHNLTIWYTGIRRRASEILAVQSKASDDGDEVAVNALHTIKAIGREIESAINSGDADRFGELLHSHWQAKKGLSAKVTVDRVDQWYDVALRYGAMGGKLMGAGGGGFLMFYCPDLQRKNRLRCALTAEGLLEMRWRLDYDGSKLVMQT